MVESFLDLLQQMKTKCEDNDCKIAELQGLSIAEYQFLLASQKLHKIESLTIAEEMGLTPSRVSRIVENLVQKKILLRETCPNDRRAIRLMLTNKGRKARKEIVVARDKCEQHMVDVLDKEELEQFQQTVKKIMKEL